MDNKTKILELLANNKRLYVREIVELSEMADGSVYTTLNRLEKQGLVETATEKREPPAIGLLRFAKITKNGRLFLKGKKLVGKAVETAEVGANA
jgi:DNA-binding IclR family transcriptional regulator